MDLSIFYYPECGNNLILNEMESDSSQDSSSNYESNPDTSNSITGFIGTQTNYISYEMLLEQLNCDIELEALVLRQCLKASLILKELLHESEARCFA